MGYVGSFMKLKPVKPRRDARVERSAERESPLPGGIYHVSLGSRVSLDFARVD